MLAAALASAGWFGAASGAQGTPPAECTTLGIQSTLFAICALSPPGGGGSLIEVVNATGRIIQCSGRADPMPNGDCVSIGTIPSAGLGFSLAAANQQQVVMIVNATAVVECTAAIRGDGKPAGRCAPIGTLTASVVRAALASDDSVVVYLTQDQTLTECSAFIDGAGNPAGQCARIGGLPPPSADAGWDFFISGPVVFFVDLNNGELHGCIPLQSPTGVPMGVCA